MLPRDLLALAAHQHGVFSLEQARDAGLSRNQLAYRLRVGTLGRAGSGIYLIAGQRATWQRQVMVAVLSVPGAMASHRTAAVLHGLDGFSAGRIEVLTEHGAWRRRSCRVHQTKDLVAGDIGEIDGIPCTTLVRTLVDLPAVSHQFRAGQALDHACRTDRSVLAQVRQRHVEVARRGRDGTVALREMIERRSADGPTVGSGFERRTLDLILDAGLPEPCPQWEVRNGPFVAYLDLAWPDLRVAVECDSLAHHFGERAHQWDRTRRRQLKLLGWDILEYTYEDVVQRGRLVVAELRHVLGRRRPSPPDEIGALRRKE